MSPLAEAPEPAREATWGSAVRLAAEGGARLLGLVTTIVVANGLGLSAFGEFAFLAGVAVLVAEVADLGLHGMTPRALLAGEFSLEAMLRSKLRLAAICGALVAALSPWQMALAALLAYFALSGWVEFLGVVARTRGYRVREAVLLVLLRIVTFAAALIAVDRGAGLEGLSLAYAASTLPVLVLAAAFVARCPPLSEEVFVVAPPTRVLRASLPLAVNGGLALMAPRVELFVLRALRSSADTGVFAAVLRMVEALASVPNAICGGAMPALTREGLRGEGPVRERTALTCALLAAPAATGILLLAPGVLALVFKPEYGVAATPLRVLALALLPLFMNSLLLHALIAVGRASLLPRLMGLRVGVATVAALVLAPAYGPLGATIGFGLSELVLLAVGSASCRRAAFPVPVLRPLALAILASLPMAAAVSFVPASTLGSIALGVAVYALTLGAVGAIGVRSGTWPVKGKT